MLTTYPVMLAIIHQREKRQLKEHACHEQQQLLLQHYSQQEDEAGAGEDEADVATLTSVFFVSSPLDAHEDVVFKQETVSTNFPLSSITLFPRQQKAQMVG